jgi:hypothetical protein
MVACVAWLGMVAAVTAREVMAYEDRSMGRKGKLLDSAALYDSRVLVVVADYSMTYAGVWLEQVRVMVAADGGVRSAIILPSKDETP